MQDNTYVVAIKPVERRHRARDAVLTLLMWAVYVYLWVPLITVAAWLLGFERFYTIMITYGGFEVVLELLDWWAFIVIAIAVCIVSWVGFNYSRFHNRERRYSAPVTKAQQISEFFDIAEAEVERVRSSKRVLIDLDEHGYIARITHYGIVETANQPTGLKPDEVSSP